MQSETHRTLVSFTIPGSIVVLGAAFLLWTGILPLEAYAAVGFYLFALIAAGALLGWRFYSSRALYALLLVSFAYGVVLWLLNTPSLPLRVQQTGLTLLGIVLPVNFAILARWRERGLSLESLVPKLTFLIVQIAVVGLLCRPEQVTNLDWVRQGFLPAGLSAWTHLPQVALLAWILAFAIIAASWWPRRRPLENAWFWALTAGMLGLRSDIPAGAAAFYFSTSALVLVLALIDTSYLLAYHDELTGIPARRAFNQAVAELQEPYTIAMVDVDNFKKLNDTYGHETGDQVLRMVAASLARVGGGGRSYRCGGEEFAIVFSGHTVEEACPYIENVRVSIEQTRFMIRGPDRSRRRRPERRYHPADRRGTPSHAIFVTVSIGMAQSDPKLVPISEVINAADKALYQAKAGGKNRVELWNGSPVSRAAARSGRSSDSAPSRPVESSGPRRRSTRAGKS
jgi:diguanylate cyclase (GGDEF)-like protein